MCNMRERKAVESGREATFIEGFSSNSRKGEDMIETHEQSIQSEEIAVHRWILSPGIRHSPFETNKKISGSDFHTSPRVYERPAKTFTCRWGREVSY